ncbi:hypothetical protein YC2023_094523 [Brassica napus]
MHLKFITNLRQRRKAPHQKISLSPVFLFYSNTEDLRTKLNKSKVSDLRTKLGESKASDLRKNLRKLWKPRTQRRSLTGPTPNILDQN